MSWFASVGIWYVGLGLTFLLGAWMLWYGLWGDRSKGRPRCPKCWYDMQGVYEEKFLCPECGHVAKSKKKLLKNRRRWGVLVVGIIFCSPSLYALNIYWGHYREQVIRDAYGSNLSETVVSIAPNWLVKRLPSEWAWYFDRLEFIRCIDVNDEDLMLLNQLRHVSAVQLFNCTFSDASLHRFLQGHEINFLDIGSTRLTDKSLERLSQNGGMDRLILKGNRQITDEGLAFIAKMSDLWDLDLSHTNITDQGLQYLIQLDQLTDIDLSGTAITESGLQYLKNNTGLNSLDLSNTKITDGAFRLLVDSFGQLSDLVVAKTSITDEGVRQLEGMKKLFALDLSYTQTTHAGLSWLESSGSMFKLLISGTQVDDELVPTLVKCHRLTFLYIDHTKIASTGLKQIIDELSPVMLGIDGNQFNERVVEYLMKKDTMPWLILIGDEIKNESLEQFTRLPSLEFLSLINTNVTDSGLSNLSEIPELTHLVIDENSHLTDAGLDHLKGISKLKDVLILGNKGITQAAVQQLDAALPGIKITWRPPDDP